MSNDNKNVYKEEVGTPVHLRFRVKHSDIPKERDVTTAVNLLIKQVLFSETQIAKMNGRELEFKPAIIETKKKVSEVSVEGILGAFITND